MENKITFRAARSMAELTQSQAADKLLIGLSTLQGYEVGRFIPKFDIVLRMAELYGVSCDRFKIEEE